MSFGDIKLVEGRDGVHMQPSINTSAMEMVTTWEFPNLYTIVVRRNTYTAFLYQTVAQLKLAYLKELL
jgi:hypothetical protein